VEFLFGFALLAVFLALAALYESWSIPLAVLMVVPLGDLPPLLRWSVALIAGGGAAGLTQVASTVARAKTAATTGGLGNPLVATGELGGSVVISIAALLFPVLALVMAVLMLWAVFAIRRKWKTRGPG